MGELVFIGLGLSDEKDMSFRAMEEATTSDKIFAEFYTSHLLNYDKGGLEALLSRTIEELSRSDVEEKAIPVKEAVDKKVAFLVAGDPMVATTHVDLRIRALEAGIDVKMIPAPSIYTVAPGLLGLQQYKFGKTTTVGFPEEDFRPTSPYEAVKENKERGLHTLVLLDIKADEGRYMSAKEGLALLRDMEKEVQGKNEIFSEDSLVCVVARAGTDESVIRAGRFSKMMKEEFGDPLHTLVIPGDLHFMEEEALVHLAGAPKDILQS